MVIRGSCSTSTSTWTLLFASSAAVGMSSAEAGQVNHMYLVSYLARVSCPNTSYKVMGEI